VKPKRAQLKDLAALHALGALDGEDVQVFAELLAASPDAGKAATAFGQVAEALAQSLPARVPPPHLKDQILRRATMSRARAEAEKRIKALVPACQDGLSFLKQAFGENWLPLPVAGAFVKLLSYDEASGYAVVLGKLDAGARYPGHAHRHPEDIYMLSGDLHVGEHLIEAGDFHHAEAGSRHGVNWSEKGCVLLAVLSKEDLMNQLVPVR
jgi:quercetin dioxygenase-like cupin family protein